MGFETEDYLRQSREYNEGRNTQAGGAWWTILVLYGRVIPVFVCTIMLAMNGEWTASAVLFLALTLMYTNQAIRVSLPNLAALTTHLIARDIAAMNVRETERES